VNDANPAAITARRMWTLFEPVHSLTYFTDAARGAFEQAGLRGFWRGYFAGRAAPLGPVQAAPVIAAFCSFAPAMVARALPAVWQLATPQQALDARLAGAVAALRIQLGLDQSAVPEQVAAAADLLALAIEDLDSTGRVLAAADAALPMPDEPLARLWQAATVLREHRGDGHVAALTAAGLDGCEALALRAGIDRAASGARSAREVGWTREQMQPIRGWTDTDWDSADARLASRGLLTAGRQATPAGQALHQRVEDATDAAAARPWARLGGERTAELAGLLWPITRACATALPYPNPVGVPAPAAT
jgi:hypothetical protein